MEYKNYVLSLQYLKDEGVSKEDALGYLEFDSDQYPDQEELEMALIDVYGEG